MAVFLVRGCGWEVATNIILCLLTFGIAGMFQALYFVIHDDRDYARKRDGRTNKRKQAKAEMKAEEKAAKHAARAANKQKKP